MRQEAIVLGGQIQFLTSRKNDELTNFDKPYFNKKNFNWLAIFFFEFAEKKCFRFLANYLVDMHHPWVNEMETQIKQILEKRPNLTIFPVIHDGDTETVLNLGRWSLMIIRITDTRHNYIFLACGLQNRMQNVSFVWKMTLMN